MIQARLSRRVPARYLDLRSSTSTRNVLSMVTSNGLTGVAGFAQGLLLAKFLGIESYGRLAVIVVSMEIINQVADVRVWETVINFVTRFLEEGDKGNAAATAKLCFLIDGGSGILATLMMLVAAPVFADRALHDRSLSTLLIIYSLGQLLCTTNTTSEALLQVTGHYRLIAQKRTALAVDRVTATAAVLVIGPSSLSSVIVCLAVVQGLNGATTSWLALRATRERLGSIFGADLSSIRAHWGPMARLTWATNLTGTLGVLQQTGGTLMLSALTSPAQVGIFRFADLLLQPVAMVHQAIYSVIYPRLVKRVGRSPVPATLKRVAYHEIRRCGGLALAFAALGTVALLSGSAVFEWGDYAPAVVVAFLMLGRDCIGLAIIWLRPVQVAIGHAHVGNIGRLVAAAIWMGGSLLIVPRFGAIGSGVLYLAAGIAGDGVQAMAFARHVHRERPA